jgi:hypothetical protein
MTGPDCRDCEHYAVGMAFELCLHAASRYEIAGKEDWHTIGHQRGPRGTCGEGATHFQRAVVTLTKKLTAIA